MQIVQSLLTLAVLKTVTTKNTVVTPAPTAASVNATSTAPISIHKRHMNRLKAPSKTTDASKSLTLTAAIAHTTVRPVSYTHLRAHEPDS